MLKEVKGNTSKGNCDVKVQIAEDERMAEQFSSEKVLELLFNDGFYISDGCSSDEECSKGPSYQANDESGSECLRQNSNSYLPTFQGFPGLSREMGSDPGIQGFLR